MTTFPCGSDYIIAKDVDMQGVMHIFKLLCH